MIKDIFHRYTHNDCAWQEFERIYSPILEKITSFSKLKENWDSYKCTPIKQEAMIKGVDILFLLYKQLASKEYGMPTPFVVPCPDGSVQFEWEKENKEVEVVIPSPEYPMSMCWSEGENISEKDNISLENMVDKLIWLIEETLEYDEVVKIQPVKEYTVKLKIKSIKKAEPKIVEPE